MSEDDAFLAGIRGEPKDDLRRLVYADWLDERGDDESRTKAEYLRLNLACDTDDMQVRDERKIRLRELAKVLDKVWKATVSRLMITECQPVYGPICPRYWDQLTPTKTPQNRWCPQCRQRITYCDSVETAELISVRTGRPVVLDLGVPEQTPYTPEIVPDPFGMMIDPELIAQLNTQLGPIFSPGEGSYTTPTTSDIRDGFAYSQNVTNETQAEGVEVQSLPAHPIRITQLPPVDWRPRKLPTMPHQRVGDSFFRRMWRMLTGR